MQRLLLLLLVILAGIMAAFYRFRKSIVDEDPVEKERYRQFREEMELKDAFRSEDDFYKHGI